MREAGGKTAGCRETWTPLAVRLRHALHVSSLPLPLLLLFVPARADSGAGAGVLPPESLVRELREARIALAAGEKEKALERLRKAAVEHPREILPILALRAYYMQAGPDETEMRKLQTLLRQRLVDADAALPAGSLRQIVEDPSLSREDLQLMLRGVEKRLEAAPDDVPLLDALARLQYRLGDKKAVRMILGRILSLRPSEAVLARCIDLDRELENWESALALLRQVRAKYGDSFWLRLETLEALAATGRYTELLQEIGPLVGDPSLRRRAVGPLLRAAWALHDQGREREAEQAFRKVLELDPGHVEARDAILNLYATQEERTAQAAALEKAWSEQVDPFVLLTEGASRLSAGDAQGSYDLLKRATAGMPDSEIAWFNFGLAAFKLERWEESREAMSRAAVLKPDFPNAHMNLGAALQKLDRCPEAIVELNRALALRPDLALAHAYLSHCYQAMGNTVEAQKHLRLSNPEKSPPSPP